MKKLTKKMIVYPMVLLAFTSGFLVGCKHKTSSSSSSESSVSSSELSSMNSFTSSSENSSSSSEKVEDVIEVKTVLEKITIKNENIFKYDYLSLFEVKVNGEKIEVTSEMVDTSKVVNKAGTYDVTCSYLGKSATVKVTVEMVETVIIKSKVDSVEIKLKEVEDYNYLSLFTITEKGRPVTVSQDMISSTVTNKEGTYKVTCSYKGVSKTIDIIVTSSYKIEIIESYHDLELSISELECFDFTNLFSLFVDDVFVPVTNDMLDKTGIASPKVGESYQVTLTYKVEEEEKSKITNIKIVEEKEIIVNGSNLVVYPNDKTIDLKSLFTITENGKEIEVTDSMIEGNINYDKIGTNQITCRYKDIVKISTIEVKKGVRITHANSSTVVIKYGTNQQTYNFANDFIVSVNGVKFNVSNSFVDTSNVDFSKEGEYVATLTIPYGENQYVLGESSLVDYSLDITYVVTKVNAVINVKQEIIKLDTTISSYDYIKNITSTVNGNNMIVTSNKDWATDPTCTYVEVVSDPVDFKTPGTYVIEIHAYPYGLDNDPIIVTYEIIIDNGIDIVESTKTTLFVGDSVHPCDYFEVTKNGQPVEITVDMIEGKVDSTTPGVYQLVLNYEGEEAVVDVVVLDNSLKGNYVTANKTIVEVNTSTSSGTDDEYSESTGEEDVEEVVVAEPLGKLIIDGTGIKTLDNKKGVYFEGIDENTILFSLSSFDYYMDTSYKGVVICNPINENKMQYSESNRPFVYFKEDEWEIIDSFTIGSSTNHVFAASSVCKSYDLVQIKNKNDNSIKWFVAKYQLVEKSNSDYFYTSSYFFYEETMPSLTLNSSYSLNLNGEIVNFTMVEEKRGLTIKVETLERIYASKILTGTVDGKEATLSFNEYQNISLVVGGETKFTTIYNNYASTKIGGIDYTNNSIKVYSEVDGYSYHFDLDLENNSFTVREKEQLFGLFKPNSNIESISKTSFFFDGYGKGIACGLDPNSTYTTYPFSYTEQNGIVSIKFDGVKDTFTYSDGIIFRIDVFKNVLRVASSINSTMIDVVYNNSSVEDGVSVKFEKTLMNMYENIEDAIDDLYSSIVIVSKDGIVLDEDKNLYIDYSYIDFTQAGFYSVGIKGFVDGEEVIKYYAIQILEPLYEDHALVDNYVSSLDSKYEFSFDKFGTGKITYKESNSSIYEYEGEVIFTSEKEFVFTGICLQDETKVINVNGVLEADGVVSLKIGGNREIYSYFYGTDVTSLETGILKNYIRAFTKDGNTTYFYLTNIESIGTKVNVASLNEYSPTEVGSIIQVTDSNNETIIICKILSWDNHYFGIQLADAYKGSYMDDSSNTLVLDGFGISAKYLGVASINNEEYAYYIHSENLVRLLDINTLEDRGYALVSTSDHSYELLEQILKDKNVAGSYGEIKYNEISTSTHNLVIDEYGVGYYLSNVTVSNDSSDEDYSEDYWGDSSSSSSTTTVSGEYYGRITTSSDGTYVFVGKTSGNNVKTVTINLTVLDDYFAKMNITGTEVNASNVYVASNYEESVKQIANNREKYISIVTINNENKYFYFATQDAALKNAIITVKNDIEFTKKGCIFSLSVGDSVIIEEAICTESSMNTHTGYVYPNELKGTYTGSNGDLVLSGFADLKFDLEGSCTLNNRARTYKVFNSNVIEVTITSTTKYLYSLDLTNKTYTRLSSNYSGSLLGEFKKIDSNQTLEFDGYSLATYTSAGGSVYNCIVTHNATTNEFSLNGLRVNDIYGDTLTINGKLIANGILQVDVNERGNEYSTYYVMEGYTPSVYSGMSSTSGIIYQVIDSNSNVTYLYSPTDKTTLDGEIIITKEEDSPFELGEVGSIFKVSKDGETIIIGKYDSSNITGGYVLANLDERKIYTSSDDQVLFTDGFATSSSSRGLATLDGKTYTYYYSNSLVNTIVLYDGEEIIYYCEYEGDNVKIIAPSLNEEVFDMGTYRKLSSPNYINGFISFDAFGYFSIENYDCKAVFNEDKTSFTFTGSDSGHSIDGSGKILERGLIFVQCSSKDGGLSSIDYYSTSQTIYSAGDDNKNIIYSVELDGKTKYLYSSTNSKLDASHYQDYVNVEVETPTIPFGTLGCVFSVYSLDNEKIFRAKWTNTTNGNAVVGHQVSDGYEGTYVNSELGDITLDGFYDGKGHTKIYGVATRNNETGTYYIGLDGSLLVTFNNVETKYFISKENKTYAEPTYDKLKDLRFTCTEKEIYYTYEVTKYFVFDGSGGVKYYLICPEDGYCSFWAYKGATGIDGTYVIEGNQITMKFPGDSYTAEPTFVFTIDNVDDPSTLTSVSTNLASYFAGYVAPGVTFVINK